MNRAQWREAGDKTLQGLIVLLLAGCSRPMEVQSPAAPPAVTPRRLSAIGVHTDSSFRPAYTVVEEHDMSLGEVSRWRRRITMPRGLPRETVQKNLEHAAWQVHEAHRGAALVLAYAEGTDTKGALTVGRCEVAPDGLWMEATAKAAPDRYRATTELSDFYFKPSNAPTHPVSKRISVGDRRRIFFAIVDADNRARYEASRRIPIQDPSKFSLANEEVQRARVRQAELRKALSAKYRKDVCGQFRVSAGELDAIYAEGLDGRWPMPRE
jgi:hypothetical protein